MRELEIENEIFKKSYRHIRKRTITEYVFFINNNLDKYTVKQMCKALKVAKSTYYGVSVRVPSNKEQEYLRFSAEVKQCFEENKKRYGAIKIHRKLTESGIPCSIKKVQRYMKRPEFRSVVVKKYNRKANQGKVLDDKENVLNRKFKAKTINRKWVTDITYIHVLKEGWTYPECRYNRQRIHSALGYKTPQQMEDEAIRAA